MRRLVLLVALSIALSAATSAHAAITYFAITSDQEIGLDVPDAVAAKLRGVVRLWYADTRLPSSKWVVVGDDIETGDGDGRLRTIKVATKNAILAEVQKAFDYSKADLANYGRSLGRGFHVDVFVTRTIVEGI